MYINLLLNINGILNWYSLKNSYWYIVNVGSGPRPHISNRGSLSSDLEATCSYQSGACPVRPGFPKSTSFRRHSNASMPIGQLPSKRWMGSENGQLWKLFTRQVISEDDFHLLKVRKPPMWSIFMSPYIRMLADLRSSLLAQHVHFHESPRRENFWVSKILPLGLMTKPSIVGRVPDHPPM